MKIDSEIKIEKYNIVFKTIDEIRGPNYLAIQGNFLVYDEKKDITFPTQVFNKGESLTDILENDSNF